MRGSRLLVCKVVRGNLTLVMLRFIDANIAYTASIYVFNTLYIVAQSFVGHFANTHTLSLHGFGEVMCNYTISL